jgi:hypothetical protein
MPFHTGGSPSAFDQNGHTWEFTWNPNNITWYTTAGGGISHDYSTEQANFLGTVDRIQCLPADVELRFNVWNLLGTTTPTGMNPNERVEVVIDQLTYTPSGETAVSNGGACSKTCQCDASSQWHLYIGITLCPYPRNQPAESISRTISRTNRLSYSFTGQRTRRLADGGLFRQS